jgi:hypothetical protein
MSGGAMKMSRTVPDTTNQTLSMAFRVTDAGELEVVRQQGAHIRRRRVCGGRTETYRSSLDGATNVPPSSGSLRYALGERTRVLAVVANAETTSELIDGPRDRS